MAEAEQAFSLTLFVTNSACIRVVKLGQSFRIHWNSLARNLLNINSFADARYSAIRQCGLTRSITEEAASRGRSGFNIGDMALNRRAA